jgi:hypothetical protein
MAIAVSPGSGRSVSPDGHAVLAIRPPFRWNQIQTNGFCARGNPQPMANHHKVGHGEHMKKSRIVSPAKRASAPLLPTLPLEVWLTSCPLLTWSLLENKNGCVFQSQLRDAEYPWKYETFRGTEYLDSLLAIETPQELVIFVNTFASPFKYHKTFNWGDFVDARKKLEDAMRLPIAKLRRHPEFLWYFDLNMREILLSAELREGVYYGTVASMASFDGCYEVIAFERLLANVKYGFCQRCHHHFRVTSRHKRKYCCSDICGHAVAQQKYRKRQSQRRFRACSGKFLDSALSRTALLKAFSPKLSLRVFIYK